MTKLGYYRNSLNAWRSRLAQEGKQLSARYARMHRMNHPCMKDQRLLMEINQEMQDLITAYLAMAV